MDPLDDVFAAMRLKSALYSRLYRMPRGDKLCKKCFNSLWIHGFWTWNAYSGRR